jgi:TonB family protein
MEPDRLWAVWAGAVVAALVVHTMAFLFMAAQPAKPKPEAITMSIAMPPPPPPPPPEPPPPPPEPPKPKAPPPPDKPLPPAPPAPPDAPPPPTDAPPPKAAEEILNLAPSTGQGVAVAVGSPDGVEGAPPVSSTGRADDVKPTNRGQSGPVPEAWDENGYKSGAWDRMNRNKQYPRKAQVMGLEGKCIVSVKLNHDGSLAAPPKLLGKGTGHAVLDAECIAMAERTTFPPIPTHVPAPITMRFPIEFVLENR